MYSTNLLRCQLNHRPMCLQPRVIGRISVTEKTYLSNAVSIACTSNALITVSFTPYVNPHGENKDYIDMQIFKKKVRFVRRKMHLRFETNFSSGCQMLLLYRKTKRSAGNRSAQPNRTLRSWLTARHCLSFHLHTKEHETSGLSLMSAPYPSTSGVVLLLCVPLRRLRVLNRHCVRRLDFIKEQRIAEDRDHCVPPRCRSSLFFGLHSVSLDRLN